jgi:hypothetical protein
VKRLPSAPFTREDLWIWAGRYTRRSWTEVSTGDAFVAQMNVIGQDNRDAELMLEAQEFAQFGPAAIELYGIAFRGWNSPAYWIEETEDGQGVWMR